MIDSLTLAPPLFHRVAARDIVRLSDAERRHMRDLYVHSKTEMLSNRDMSIGWIQLLGAYASIYQFRDFTNGVEGALCPMLDDIAVSFPSARRFFASEMREIDPRLI